MNLWMLTKSDKYYSKLSLLRWLIFASHLLEFLISYLSSFYRLLNCQRVKFQKDTCDAEVNLFLSPPQQYTLAADNYLTPWWRSQGSPDNVLTSFRTWGSIPIGPKASQRASHSSVSYPRPPLQGELLPQLFKLLFVGNYLPQPEGIALYPFPQGTAYQCRSGRQILLNHQLRCLIKIKENPLLN